jgi:catechol-2,3-dioxygenase
MVSLWAIKEEPACQFNKNRNIGLHHVAFHVRNEDDLNNIHEKLARNRIAIEFSPELLGQGPAKHMMCFEPSGIRVEFIWPGN